MMALLLAVVVVLCASLRAAEAFFLPGPHTVGSSMGRRITGLTRRASSVSRSLFKRLYAPAALMGGWIGILGRVITTRRNKH